MVNSHNRRCVAGLPYDQKAMVGLDDMEKSLSAELPSWSQCFIDLDNLLEAVA